MASDKLSELLVPSLIERFDAVPAEQPLTISITKGEVAYLIKSQYQLHNGLSALLAAVGDAFHQSDIGQRALSESGAALQASQQSLTAVTNSLIERIVRAAGGL